MLVRRFSFALGSLVLLAATANCGGGDSTDKSFVRDICKASSTLQTEFTQATKDASTISDSSKAMTLLSVPISHFASSFAKASPPSDLKQWHDDAAKTINTAADEFKKTKDFKALSGFSSSPIPDPPIAAKQRLKNAAAGVKECNGVAVFRPD